MIDPAAFTRRHALGGVGAAACTLAVGGVARAAAKRVDIVMTQGNTGLIVHEIAKSQGFFDQLGVAPNVLQVSDGSKCVAALVSGASQICIYSGFNQLTPAIERGAGVKILAGALNLPSVAMFSGRPNIQHVADLRGKVLGIGAPGSVLHQMTVLLLRKKGVDPNSVTFRNVGSNADVFKAVAAKTVDAGLSDIEVWGKAAGFGAHALPDGLLWKEIPEYTNQASYASDAAIRQDRDAIVRTLAAYGKAYRYVSGPASQGAYVRARQKVTGQGDVPAALSQWNWIQQNHPYATNLVLSQAQVDTVQKLDVEFKVQRQVLPFNQITDMSIARDAVKLI
jgi:ABC-type nitrate/sulfonate/bicarbonate transport system substrate-binding protein